MTAHKERVLYLIELPTGAWPVITADLNMATESQKHWAKFGSIVIKVSVPPVQALTLMH